ncbi:peroxisomal biogenesis factor 3-like [Sycon ciliatum]|uniref:peroxisomal biogenesis factor 3-like n=1 Tax=Sycon ciliatum TaxID=27933 RepID=UPI0020AB8317
MGLLDFLKRHQRKFYITGAIVGGAFALGKFAQWKLAEYSDRVAAEEVARARKKHHYDSNQRTCKMTAIAMLPSLRERLFNALDTEALTTKLKSSPENKILTWQELKTVTFARFLSSVYACCLLISFLRVQLNILGGCMYHGEMQTGSSLFHIFTEVHKEYLAVVQYFLGPGLTRLIDVVQSKVQDSIGSVSLKEKVDVADIERMIATARQAIEVGSIEQADDTATTATSASADAHRSLHPLVTFLLPPESNGGTSEETPDQAESEDVPSISPDAQAYITQLMGHTRDVLESQDFKSTLSACLDCGFQFGSTGLAESMLTPSVDHAAAKIPLARVVPILNAQTHGLFAHQGDGVVSSVMSLELLNQFSANVYEAYSHEISFE